MKKIAPGKRALFRRRSRIVVKKGHVPAEKKVFQSRDQIALELEKDRAQTYWQMAGVMMIALDLDCKVTKINQKASEILGYSEAELLGKNWIDTCVPPKRRAAVRRMFKKIVSGREKTGEYFENEILTKNGDLRSVSWHNALARDRQGKIIGSLSSGEDITEKKIAEESEKLYQRQLIQADKMISLGTLVAGVTHEINNPNNAIMFNTPLLKEIFDDIQPILESHFRDQGDFLLGGLPYSELKMAVRDLFEGIMRSSDRIKLIVKDLKNFARSEPLDHNHKINLNEVVQLSYSLLGNYIKKRTDRFEMHLDQDLPLCYGNFQRLEQTVISLIQNACQALRDRNESIHLTTAFDRRQQRVILKVEDEGMGIPADQIRYITDPFYTTRRNSGGIGLGLAIVSRIVKDHNGELEIRSHEGRGASFVVSLPIIPSAAGRGGKK